MSPLQARGLALDGSSEVEVEVDDAQASLFEEVSVG